ncbi:hypothetical protein [Mangrovivirga cuniculi]|nr:hypothetical protein [Mangrovivirga cuniculi]
MKLLSLISAIVLLAASTIIGNDPTYATKKSKEIILKMVDAHGGMKSGKA